MIRTLIKLSFVFIFLMSFAVSANATLSLRSAYQDAAISVDAWGGSSSGLIQSDVPAGSTVLAAFLYSSDVWGGGTAGDVTLASTFLSSASGTLLTPNSNPVNTMLYNVTDIVKPIIEAGSGVIDHTISESGYSDGEVLAVIYSNASTIGNTAIIMDGELSTTGDSTTLGFDSPYVSGDLFVSLGISYSYGDGQYTEVDITTDSTTDRRLSSAAGGNDDGGFIAADGALITAGGVGDDPANPANPFARGDDYDDELYNLALGNSVDTSPFINSGDTFLTLDTVNPSNDDNVFTMFLSSTFKISDVDDQDIPDIPDDNVVPEPSTFMLFGFGLLAFANRRRRLNV